MALNKGGEERKKGGREGACSVCHFPEPSTFLLARAVQGRPAKYFAEVQPGRDEHIALYSGPGCFSTLCKAQSRLKQEVF